MRPAARRGAGLTRVSDDVPLTLWGDRHPPEVIFREGFLTRGTSDDLLSYATDNIPSAFVGLLARLGPGDRVTDPGGYHYVIQKPGGIDVNAALGTRSPFPHELEVAFGGGIQPNYVVGVNRVLGDRTLGEFAPNPAFRPG